MIDKISANILRKTIYRYQNKKTVFGQYTRYKDCANLCFLVSGVELLRLPSWQIEDVGICSMLITLVLKNVKNAYKTYKTLKPIKQRALSIKRLGFRKEL